MHSTTPTNEAAGLAWKKSSYSGGAEGQCVEVADVSPQNGVAVRDSKNPDGPVIVVGTAAFSALVTSLQDAHPCI
ncbi:DUF397 domain-containing protein [Streptomyces sp. NPDC053792]|uniref:DUF397 domain-containing protein n=1 Tax=Streptomyces sp. NPDC053792 TaxID=3365716 RepID=UPI0037D237CA